MACNNRTQHGVRQMADTSSGSDHKVNTAHTPSSSKKTPYAPQSGPRTASSESPTTNTNADATLFDQTQRESHPTNPQTC
ncbi:uncharacterized protein METZ01_LOCUS341974 [marine metagenome]|uniref:Uncharacterized protein n=1 Tax=marine metagenome TaxID=408172 RepID=A0A382QW20_9ZZZZ